MITVHIAGEYGDGVQRCIRCGAMICDDRGAMIEEDQPMLAGFPQGSVSQDENCFYAADDPDGRPCEGINI